MNLQIVEQADGVGGDWGDAAMASAFGPGTSAGGAMRQKTEKPAAIILSGAFFLLGTGSEKAIDWNAWIQSASVSTTASELWIGPLTVDPIDNERAPASSGGELSRSAIHEIRRLTGLTWDELARIFGVSRRSLHFWASGKPLAAQNEERLHRVLTTVRQIDRGSAAENRTALRSAAGEAGLIIDLLAGCRFEEVVQLMGTAQPRKRPRLAPLSVKTRTDRKPLSPGETVGALHDSIHRDLGKSRPARAARMKK